MSPHVMRTLVAHLRWRTPHEMLKGEMPNINHLCVFGCGAFVYLQASARANKMAPKLELMTYVSVALGNECNFLFMCSTNAVFTAAHAVFDERHFPHCPTNLLRTLLEGQIQNLPLIDQGIPLMMSTVMTMWNTTMASHIPKCRMMIQSTRNLRLLRKSLIK